MTKPLQTTIAGSLPKPSWLATPAALWAPWRLDGDALGDRRVLEQHAGAIARRRDHVVLGLALRDRELDAGRIEQVALDLEVGELVVGEQDAWHERETSDGPGTGAA